MLKKLSEKLLEKFPSTTQGYSMAKIACLFLRSFFICKQAQ